MKYEEIGCFRNMTLSQVTKLVWREQLRKSFFFLNVQVKLHPSENFNDVHDIFFFLSSFCAVRSVSSAISVSDGKADH